MTKDVYKTLQGCWESKVLVGGRVGGCGGPGVGGGCWRSRVGGW